jgi:hypothetical protein
VSSGLLERWICHHQRVSEREVRLSGTTVRPMLRDDVVAAADAVRRGDWGDREAFFRFAAAHSNCRPILAERDGEIVGTGVATVSRISMQSPRSTHGRPARTDATSWRRAMAGSSLEPLAR